MRCKSCSPPACTSHGFPISQTELKLLQGIQHLPVVQYLLLRQEGEQTLPAEIPKSKHTNRSYGVSIRCWNHERICLALHFPLLQSAAVCCLWGLPEPFWRAKSQAGPSWCWQSLWFSLQDPTTCPKLRKPWVSLLFVVYLLFPLNLPTLWAVQMCWYHPGPCITFLLGKREKNAAVAVPMEIYYFNKILWSTQTQTNSCSETSCFPWIHWISGWAWTYGW